MIDLKLGECLTGGQVCALATTCKHYVTYQKQRVLFLHLAAMRLSSGTCICIYPATDI